ncbi:XRE family transcriptional regulator [Sphingomonas flavalba]|uniref:XRE family transcriptional regulator n=1 Tax=Sphingomonas flavalba TaxID=2559804 RepID=UPI00109DB7E4|nr:XRE family transcriptional regulator [Sphingomonas flavalba]
MAANDNIIQFSKAARDESLGRLLIPERLLEARLTKRWNQSELANAVGVTRQSISTYEMGTKKPEPTTMAAIARELEQPISFFTRGDLPTFGPASANFYRKVGADTKRRNSACAVYADWLAQTAYAFDAFVNYPELNLPSFEPHETGTNRYSEEEIEQIAETVRDHFGLGLGPISNVVRLLESKGIIVCRVVIPDEKIEAFSFWRGDRAFVFLASDKDSAARARLDAAHELGHLCMHQWVGAEEIEDEKTLKEIEKEADRFAAAFLLPRKSFPNEIYSPRLLAFVDLKQRWKVSIAAMVYRCKSLGIFDEQQVTNLYKQISARKWRKQEPLDGPDGLPLEQPLLLTRIAEMVLMAGRIKRDELKAALGFSSSVIEKLVGLPPGALDNDDHVEIAPSLK